MRLYKIMDSKGNFWGYLEYSDKKNKFNIQFREIDIETEKPPAFIRVFYTTKGRKLDSRYSMMWVEDRIIPKDRQNIVDVLKAIGKKVYREIDMLELNMGRATYDDLYLERIEGK
jgi:hypothetical protein